MLRNGFHLTTAESILSEIQLLRDNYYYFLGRTYVWGSPDVPPTTQTQTQADDSLIRTDSLYYKRIQPSDISFVVNRYTWQNGTVYAKWDHSIDMSGLKYYVVVFDDNTQKYNVYKCLDNNSNASSTVTPSGTSYTAASYADGYIWKFMYAITQASMTAFGSMTKMPIQVAMTSSFYNKGTISEIAIIDGGTGYPANTTITITGDGDGAQATPVIVNGVITDIQMTSHGSGYTYANVTTSSTTGNTAVLKASFDLSAYNTEQAAVEQLAIDGAIHCIKISNGGTYYSSGTTIQITGDGIGATARLTIINGVITKIAMTAIGSGYTYANVTITDPKQSERPANAVNFSGYAILCPNGGHGKNAVRELMATELTLSTTIPLMSFQNANDFRQFGIVKNPLNFSSGKYTNVRSDLVAYKVVMNTTASMVIDGILTSNSSTDTTSKYRVIYFNQLNNEVILQPLTKNSKTPTSLFGVISYTVQSVSTYPAIDKYSGDLLYVSNHTPFATVPSQNITLKTLIKF